MLKNESMLLNRASKLEGLSFHQLANQLQIGIPSTSSARKGWTGQAIELFLGGEAKSQSGPDFPSLGVELKTIPLNQHGRPTESTFISTIALTSIHLEKWETSSCLAKLKRILWVPVEGDKTIDFACRRIGKAFFWSPTVDELLILKQDWIELTSYITLGRLNELSASFGTYLQVRPKAANAKSLRKGFDAEGHLQLTLPRGFYLRATFTKNILRRDNCITNKIC